MLAHVRPTNDEAQDAPRGQVLTAHGRTQTYYAWFKETGIPAATIRFRVVERGMSPEDAVSAARYTKMRDVSRANGQPGAASWQQLEWEDDDHAWYVVAHHPDGLSLDQVAELVGLTRERVRQIEVRALRKLNKHAAALREFATEPDNDNAWDGLAWAAR